MSSLLLGPQDLGWPASRARRFFVFVLREGAVRLTSSLDTLKRIFRRTIPSSGPGADMFYHSDQAIVDAALRSKTTAATHAASALAPHSAWESTLGPGQSGRLA
eukprot:12598572-Alexandrium_andersonii.AAC.1